MAKTIEYKIKVVNESGDVVEKTAKSFNDLNKSQQSLQSELQKTNLGSDKYKQLQKELKNTSGAIEDAKNKTTPLTDRLKEMPGITGQVAQSFGGLGQTMKVLAANPLGAVIAAIGLVFVALSDALKKNDGMMDKVNKSFAQLSGLLDPIIGLVQKLLGVVVEFGVAAVDAFTGLVSLFGDTGKAAATAAKESARLNEELDQIEDAERAIAVERAQQNKLIAEAREKLSDANIPLKERQKALADVKKSEESLAQKEVELAKRRLKMLKDQQALEKARGEDNLETTKAIEQATINLANTETDLAAKKRMFNKQEKAMVKEDEAAQKEAHQAYLARVKEKNDARKSALDLEKGYRLNSIQDEREKSLLSIEYARTAQYNQIEDLKVSLARKNELKKMADEEAERQRKLIEQKYAQEALDFQQQQTLKLIKNADDRAVAELKIANEKEIERINKLKITEEEKNKYLLNQQIIFDSQLEALNNAKLEKQKQADLKALQDKIDLEVAKEATTEEQRQVQLDNIKKYLDAQMEIELASSTASDDQKLLIKNKYANATKTIQDSITDNAVKNSQKEIDAERAKLKATADALGTLSELLGKETEGGKVAAVAQALINTYLGVSQVLTDKTLPTFAKLVGAAAVVATGVKAVSSIKSVNTNVPKYSQGGYVSGVGSSTLDNIPAMLSNGESVINSTSTRLFSPLLSAINEAGGGKRFAVGGLSNPDKNTESNIKMNQSLSGLMSSPVKAYVVSSDLTSTQQYDRVIKSRSTI